MTNDETQELKKNRNAYMREYRKRNKDKIERIQARYYANKLKQWEDEAKSDTGTSTVEGEKS